MHYHGILEEELKNKVANEWFRAFDATVIEGNIDFALYPKHPHGEPRPLLWAEAKTGDYPLPDMLAQLVLTIGKARTFDHVLPPPFLGALDGQKIAFMPYEPIAHIFHQSDFNWNVTPSDHRSREFVLVQQQIANLLDTQAISVFDYDIDAAALRAFIHGPLSTGAGEARVRIDKNNFYPIYLRWLETVKPNIAVDWADLKQHGILDSDFFLADLFVDDRDTVSIHDDLSIRESLFVVFQSAGYRIAKENLRGLFDAVIAIKNLQAYQQFWAKYKRPPLQEYQEYIITRRDLLVPQDIRERKGAFFTPRQWVELSQQYLADYLGENWQEEYYVWDCAAGTGNLLVGLTNRYRIFASTLDAADVSAMRERAANGANLLPAYTFQFDFLNDEFIPQSQGGKLPDDLYAIISDTEKRKKLVIYINPPYAEAGSARQVAGTGRNKGGVSLGSTVFKTYKTLIGNASNDVFSLFLVRVYSELEGATLATFSKLKVVKAPNFSVFRQYFKARLERLFIVPAYTFDNVRGMFPIGFHIWDTAVEQPFTSITANAYDDKGEFLCHLPIECHDSTKKITSWITRYKDERTEDEIGRFDLGRNDFQHNQYIRISKKIADIAHSFGITKQNLLVSSIYFAVRHCIEHTWLNDRDQFLYPHDGWQQDTLFHGNCLAYVLFHGKNYIKSADGVNYWIPFTEQEVNAQRAFESHFMTDFIKESREQRAEDRVEVLVLRVETKPKNPISASSTLPFPAPSATNSTLHSPHSTLVPENCTLAPYTLHSEHCTLDFGDAATAVFSAGRALWCYYHAQPHANPNASYYDIREHFQGRNAQGRMNPKSNDPSYTALLTALRGAMSQLAKEIEPKVYQYGFLR